MLQKGDLVKVIGKRMSYGTYEEAIPIGTVCRVIRNTTNPREVYISSPSYPFLEVIYPEDVLEKGHFEWIKD